MKVFSSFVLRILLFFLYFLDAFDFLHLLHYGIEDCIIAHLEDSFAREDAVIGLDVEFLDIDVELFVEQCRNILQHTLAVYAAQGDGVYDIALCNLLGLFGLHKWHISAPTSLM